MKGGKHEQWGLPGSLGGRPTIKTKASLGDSCSPRQLSRARSRRGVPEGEWTQGEQQQQPKRMSSFRTRRRHSRDSSCSSTGSTTSSDGSGGTPEDEEGWLACVSTPPATVSFSAHQQQQPGVTSTQDDEEARSELASSLNLRRRSGGQGLSSGGRSSGHTHSGRQGVRVSYRAEGDTTDEEGQEDEEEEEEAPRKCQDYPYLAKEYSRIAPYRDLDGSHPCAMCGKNECLHVFFPCQHKCVCPDCIRANDIGDIFMKGKWAYCPVCCGDIKRIIRHNGHEVEDYWKWVLDVKPTLPPGFEYKWAKSGRSLRRQLGIAEAADLEPESDVLLEEYAEQCRQDFKLGYTFDEPEDMVSRSCTCTVS